MSEPKVQINQISNRQYMISPAVQSGNDKECSNKDFCQGDFDVPNLGRLGLGTKVIHRRTQIPYTIISFEKAKISKLNLTAKINSIIELMYKVSHPYLFRLLNHYETEDRVFLIFEPYEGDSLDHLIQQGKLDIQTIFKYFVEILLGIQYMHNFGLYNLNIYPENILIGECVKLTDYGLKMAGKNDGPKRVTKVLTKDDTTYTINGYHTPEEIMGIKKGESPASGPKTDSWNCGILLFEMLTNFQSPFKGETDAEYIDSLINAEIDLSLIEDEFCRELISNLVRKDPKDRIDIDDLLKIDYIRNINIDQPEIDPSDYIINPEEEEECNDSDDNGNEEDEKNEEDDNNRKETEDKDEIIKKLRKEINSLKKSLLLSKELGKDSKKLDKEEKHYRPQLNSLQTINLQSNEIADDEEQNNDMLYESKGDNKNENKNDKNSSTNSELDDKDESSSEANINSGNIYTLCEQYKEKYLKSKKKLKKLRQKVKDLNDIIEQLEKEKKQIQEQKTLNVLNNFEKLKTSKINNINELSNIILNSISLFKESQQTLDTKIAKLISISEQEHLSLIEENQKYIDNKGKIFFEILKSINSNGNKLKEGESEKKDEDRKRMDRKKDKEIEELKVKYEMSKQKEELLNEKIKALEERNNATSELNKKLMKKHEEMYNYYIGELKIDNKKEKSKE